MAAILWPQQWIAIDTQPLAANAIASYTVAKNQTLH